MNETQVKNFRNLIKATEEAVPEDFSMRLFVNECGTPACVLGNYAARRDLQKTYVLKGTQVRSGGSQWGLFSKAEEHFGLTGNEAWELFSSGGCGQARTPAQAVKYLKQFLAKKVGAK